MSAREPICPPKEAAGKKIGPYTFLVNGVRRLGMWPEVW